MKKCLMNDSEIESRVYVQMNVFNKSLISKILEDIQELNQKN